jgi:hypothetical protein
MRGGATAVAGIFLSVIALVAAATFSSASAATTTYTDVPATSPIAADVGWAVSAKISTGYSNGTFRPDNAVDNRTMSAFLYRQLHAGAKAPACTRKPFTDVPVGSTFCGEISWLKAQKIFTSSTGTFAPTMAISRERAAIWLYRLAKASSTCRTTFSDVKSSAASCPAVTWAMTQGLDNGPTSGSFRATSAMTRGTTATWLHRLSDVLHPVLGADVSHPQCAAAGSSAVGPLPKGPGFAVVGVNAGVATTTNSCLAAELAWARGSAGGSAPPKVQLYVNTANPGAEAKRPSTWPTSGSSDKYKTCNGTDTAACAYLYGRARAAQDYATAGISSPGDYVWWLDVETVNTWDTSTGGTARNVAVLEGMADYLTAKKVAGVGLYATHQHWTEVVGSSVASGSSLYKLPSWLAGSASLSDARRACGTAALTKGGAVRMTQFIEDGFDRDHSCT